LYILILLAMLAIPACADDSAPVSDSGADAALVEAGSDTSGEAGVQEAGAEASPADVGAEVSPDAGSSDASDAAAGD